MFVIKLCYFIYDINTVQKKEYVIACSTQRKIRKKVLFLASDNFHHLLIHSKYGSVRWDSAYYCNEPASIQASYTFCSLYFLKNSEKSLVAKLGICLHYTLYSISRVKGRPIHGSCRTTPQQMYNGTAVLFFSWRRDYRWLRITVPAEISWNFS